MTSNGHVDAEQTRPAARVNLETKQTQNPSPQGVPVRFRPPASVKPEKTRRWRVETTNPPASGFCVTGICYAPPVAPVAVPSVTVPDTRPLIRTSPVGEMLIGNARGVESVLRNTSVTLRSTVEPSAGAPSVATFSVQGFTVMTAPWRSTEVEGNVELVIVKIHDPILRAPVAVLPPEAIAKVGAADVPARVTVVAAVVPKSGTPAAKAKGWEATASARVVVTETGGRFTVATGVAGPSLPPPQPTTIKETARTLAARLNLLFIIPQPMGG
jgi:hypothetical protein